jgi:hypothetical protein
MNQETSLYLDQAEAYIQKAIRELALARQQEAGTRAEAGHLFEARLALDNASTVVGRTLPN